MDIVLICYLVVGIELGICYGCSDVLFVELVDGGV